jgi:hypothetical protein
MKKTLLALFALGMSSVAVAQTTHSDFSNNKATLLLDGYSWNFDGTAANNCGPEATLDVLGSTKFDWAMGPEEGQITHKNLGTGTGYYATMKMDNNDCNGTADYASLEIPAPCAVRIACKATVAGGDILMHLNATVGGYAQGADITVTGISDADFTIYTFSFTSAEAGAVPFSGGTFSGIEGLGLATAFPGGVAGDLIINWIEVGSTVGSHTSATSTEERTLNGAAINVYPVPSSDELNVDLSNLDADAELKLVSSNGQTVYTASASNTLSKINVSEYTAGIYALQITSGGKSLTKTVVIK